MMAGADWTTAEDEVLRGLWNEGFSTAEIARRMARSKNSVVGRAHRQALPSRPAPIPERRYPRMDAAQLGQLRVLADGTRTQAQISALMRVHINVVRQEMAALSLPAANRMSLQSAAAVARAQANTETLRAGAFRRHAQPGGGAAPLAAAHPIPASAGVPVRAGDSPEGPAEVAGAVLDVSSLTAPPVSVRRAPAGASSDRRCRWPMWGNAERATGVFCAEPVRRKRDGAPCVYCAAHAAKAFSRHAEPEEDEPPRRFSRSTFSWGGQAA